MNPRRQPKRRTTTKRRYAGHRAPALPQLPAATPQIGRNRAFLRPRISPKRIPKRTPSASEPAALLAFAVHKLVHDDVKLNGLALLCLLAYHYLHLDGIGGVPLYFRETKKQKQSYDTNGKTCPSRS
eukprot:637046-Prorocentrum_minimum.AAC.2